jgi:hypothetical protein
MDLDWLLQQPDRARDQAWETAVLDCLINTKVQLQDVEPREGPDGWPYLFVRTGGNGTEPFSKIIQWLATRGIGLVVNGHKMLPDYVFTYGMLWNFFETGRFTAPELISAPAGEVRLVMDDRTVMGAPTEKYLPTYVRSLLRDFLKQQGFDQPRILVVSLAPDYKVTDLVFSTESLEGLEGKDQQTMAEALAWFLPTHYSLVFASEMKLPPFHPL